MDFLKKKFKSAGGVSKYTTTSSHSGSSSPRPFSRAPSIASLHDDRSFHYDSNPPELSRHRNPTVTSFNSTKLSGSNNMNSNSSVYQDRGQSMILFIINTVILPLYFLLFREALRGIQIWLT